MSKERRSKVIAREVAHCSLEKDNFEGREVRRIAFPDETYTYPKQNVYVLR